MERARASFKSSTWAGASTAFQPGQLSAVSAWLRVSQATSDGNGISSVPDAMNTNPAVQSVDARKPVIELSANGLPCMRFVTNDVLVWPITAQSSATNYAGWGLWVKMDSVASTQRLVTAGPGTNGASGYKLILSNQAAGSGLQVIASSSGTAPGVKSFIAGAVSTAWQFVTLEYDKDAATDTARLVMTLDGAQVTGTISGSQDLSAGLFAATGNVLIGNLNDGAASGPFQGLMGPNIYAFASKMPGATLGLLTTEARAFLMNYGAPT